MSWQCTQNIWLQNAACKHPVCSYSANSHFLTSENCGFLGSILYFGLPGGSRKIFSWNLMNSCSRYHIVCSTQSFTQVLRESKLWCFFGGNQFALNHKPYTELTSSNFTQRCQEKKMASAMVVLHSPAWIKDPVTSTNRLSRVQCQFHQQPRGQAWTVRTYHAALVPRASLKGKTQRPSHDRLCDGQK